MLRELLREDGSCIATRDRNHRPAGCRRGGGTPPERDCSPYPCPVRSPLKIGVLALQGDVREHLRAVDTLGFATEAVRRAAELDSCDALVIPGGESTTMAKLARVSRNLGDPMKGLDVASLPKSELLQVRGW